MDEANPRPGIEPQRVDEWLPARPAKTGRPPMRTGGSHGEAPWQPHDPRAAGQTPNRSATQAEAACATPHTVLAEKWADENARIAGRGTGRKRRGPAPSAVEQVTTRDGRLARLGSRYPVIRHPARVVAGAGTLRHTSAHKGSPLFHRRAPAATGIDPWGLRVARLTSHRETPRG